MLIKLIATNNNQFESLINVLLSEAFLITRSNFSCEFAYFQGH
jgi:hypothetical protein